LKINKMARLDQRGMWFVVIITLAGAWLRLHQLNAVPLRGDEAFTVIHWMREPLAQTLANIVTVDPQAPLSYALYRAYALVVGSQENVVRFLPALFSIMGIPVLFALGKRLFATRTGVIAALIWAFHPFMLWHAQDARNYAIWSVTNPLALWLALRALDRGRRLDWFLYVAAAVLSLYIYYLELFTLAALNVYVFTTALRKQTLLLRWVIAQCVIALLIAPWYLQDRLLSGGGYTGTTANFDFERLLNSFLPTLVFGEAYPLISQLGVLLLVFIVIMLGLLLRRSISKFYLLLLLLLIPLVGIAIVSTRLNVFAPRYVLSVSVILSLILAYAFTVRFKMGVLMKAVAGFVFLVQLLSVSFLVHDYAKSPDWRALSLYLQDRVTSTDLIVQAAADESFTFYCTEYTLSQECDQKLPANPQQSQTEIASILTMRSPNYRSIWYVANPPAWQNAPDALDWFKNNLQLLRETTIAGLAVRQFMPYEVFDLEGFMPINANFEDIVILEGTQLWLEPNGDIFLWIYGSPLGTTETPLKFFVHLLNGNMIYAQDDQFPQEGRLDSTNWQPNDRFRDVFQLSINPLGAIDYTLIIGLYNPITNERILLPDGTDHYTLPITIPSP